MTTYLRLKIFGLLIFVVAFGASCSQKDPKIVQLAPLPESICRIAVMPSINKTEYRDGDVLFYRVFTSELSRDTEFDLVQEGDIRKVFRQIGLSPGLQLPDYDQLRIIGDHIKSDILLSSVILQMQEVSLKGENIPFMTVKVDILDSKTGKTLWSIYHMGDGTQYRKAMHFGVITTITQLSRQISEEIIVKLHSEGLTGKCIE